MTLKIPSGGEVELLRSMLGDVPAVALTLKLYTNDHTPGDNDSVLDYTEMSGQGYVSKELAPAGWTFQALSLVAEATHTAQVWPFTAGGPTPIYGYYVVGTVDGLLRWAERFTPTFSAELAGDTLTVTPKITFSSF